VLARAVWVFALVTLGLGLAAVTGAIDGPGWVYVAFGAIGVVGIPLAGRHAQMRRRHGSTWRGVTRTTVAWGVLAPVFAVIGVLYLVAGDPVPGIALLGMAAGAGLLAVIGLRELRGGKGLDPS
jgi:hypothetical protein